MLLDIISQVNIHPTNPTNLQIIQDFYRISFSDFRTSSVIAKYYTKRTKCRCYYFIIFPLPNAHFYSIRLITMQKYLL